MNDELAYQIDRAIKQGKFEEVRDEIYEALKSAEPIISEIQLDEFLKSPVYFDFLREMQAWVLDLESVIVSGQSENSIEYLRGCIQGVRTAMGFPEYLRKQIQDSQEDEDNGS